MHCCEADAFGSGAAQVLMGTALQHIVAAHKHARATQCMKHSPTNCINDIVNVDCIPGAGSIDDGRPSLIHDNGAEQHEAERAGPALDPLSDGATRLQQVCKATLSTHTLSLVSDWLACLPTKLIGQHLLVCQACLPS